LKALVLAAGLGERMEPLSKFVPKPLFPLLDRPIILWVFDALRGLGVESAIVNLHHLGEKIRGVLGSEQEGIRITYSWEPKLLGTGGAIKKLKTHLAADHNLLVINSDCVFLGPLEGLAKAHARYSPVATLCVAGAKERYAPVHADDEGTIAGIGAYGNEGSKMFMFLGAHIISDRVLALFPDVDAFGIVRDVYSPAIAGGGLRAWRYDGQWLDCGTKQLYIESSNFLLDNPDRWPRAVRQAVASSDSGVFVCRGAKVGESARLVPPAFIGEGARIEKSEVGPHVVVGRNSTVESARLKNGIVWPDTEVRSAELANFIASPFATDKIEP